MDWDDVIYLSVLFFMIGIGNYIRRIKDGKQKQWISTCIGIGTILLVAGLHIIHPLIVVVINSIIVLFTPKRYCHVLSFAFCFCFLGLFRTIHYFGFSQPPAHLNAVLMILVLKMVGLAFEIQDSYLKSKNPEESSQLSYIYTKVQPSILDIFHYAFCHIGLLAGPYYKFRTYWDWVHQPYSTCAPVSDMLLRRLRHLPFVAVANLLGNYYFPLQYVLSGEIYSRSIFYRWWYMTPLFFNFRMRLYIGFGLSECTCIAAGLGVYPSASEPKSGAGPTKYEAIADSEYKDENEISKLNYNFETIHNVNEYGSEFVTTVREGMRCWNMTVQYWLAMFVYKRVKSFRVAITMLTSAFWHGVYPGYYFCLLTVPFVLVAEDAMDRALRKNATPKGKQVYDWICWVIKMQAFAYMGMGFYLLRIDDTVRFLGSVLFFGHILIVVFYLLGNFISKKQKVKPE